MLAIRPSIQKSLRWLRRTMVVVLIVSNFVTVVLADAAPLRQDSRSSSSTVVTFYAPWSVETASVQPAQP